jgi:hypothetical protein
MTTRKKKTEVHLIRYFGGPGVQQVAGKKKRPRRYAQATRARRCLAFHCCWLGEGEPKKKISRGKSGAACVWPTSAAYRAAAAALVPVPGGYRNLSQSIGAALAGMKTGRLGLEGLLPLPHDFFCHNPEFSDFNYDSISLKLYPNDYCNYDNVCFFN